MKSILSRPAKRRALAFFSLLLMALLMLGVMIARNFHHFDTALSYVSYSHRIQNVAIELQQSLINYLIKNNPNSKSVALAETLAHIDGLIADNVYLSASTKTNLETVRQMLTDLEGLDHQNKNDHLSKALTIMAETLDHETLQRETLLEEITLDTQKELYSALVIFLLPLIGALLFLHFRILHPLNDLRILLERLTEENYTPIGTAGIDPLLLPIFTSYNEMVSHLAELEEAKRLYAQSLQQEVRLATHALLEQQNSLARTERLAAIGEVAAELAHEIRNPLAGIQMAFNNLRKESRDPSQSERLELISSELKRLAMLLNDMLKQSKHAPEAISHFDVSILIHDLFALTRYQIPETIELVAEMPTHLSVDLPESGLRQMLLNLILNAAGVLGNQPGRICVGVQCENQQIIIKVSDNGPGFPRDLIEYGIRPFRTTRPDGTGLGLAMVQRFVKQFGGTIKLGNNFPQGACVTVFLPKQYLPPETR